MEFDTRSKGSSGMVFSGDYEPGTRLSQTVELGDEVMLQVNGNQLKVIVDSIEGDA
ncbi:MAG: hypothetical protein AWU57_860 [Marinobacter sp. T13-3]|nr:MAG: hypothetical protein AWU57_860 [Marinobacter sp. T13-3]